MIIRTDRSKEIPLFIQDEDSEIVNNFEFPCSFIINGGTYVILKTLEITHKKRFDLIFLYKNSSKRVMEEAKKLLSKEGVLIYKEEIHNNEYKKYIENSNRNAIILDVDCEDAIIGEITDRLNSNGAERKFVLCGNFEKEQNIYIKIREAVEKNKTLNLKYYDSQKIHTHEGLKNVEQTVKLYLDELICLDNHREILDKIFTVFNKTEAEFGICNKMPDNAKVYIWKNVKLNEKQKQCIRKKNCELIQIPDAYFKLI